MPKIEKEIVVLNKKGIHARPAALFVQLANKFDVAVSIEYGGEKINGKSIMGLLTLGVQHKTLLKVTVDGDSAEQAMKAMEDFFSKQEEDLTP